MTPKPKLLFLITEDWYFWSHRLDLARAAHDAGMEVLVATRVQDHGARIEKEGIRLIPIHMRRSSWNPLREAAAILEIVRIYRRERPDVTHHVAMKPILYGAVAARAARVPAVVNAFAGLGYAFIADGPLARVRRLVLQRALRWALASRRAVTVFQNDEDRALLVEQGLVPRERTRLIRGAGVNTAVFVPPSAEPAGEPVVLLPARMLWVKGVGEFVEAATLLKRDGVQVRFVLVGQADEDNPACIAVEQLRRWQEAGTVEWWGHREDMPAVLSSTTVVALPSYREGLPKALLEAAACERPLVAADVPGCREIVRNGVNGLLVPPRDAQGLARAIKRLLQDEGLRRSLGRRGREIVLKEFSSEQVARETVSLYRDLLAQVSAA